MVAAAERTGVATGRVHQLGSFVGAAVVQNMHLAFAVPCHDHRNSVIDIDGEEVPGVGYLAFVADKNPGLAPDALHFQLEDFRVGVDAAMQACGFNQPGKVFSVVRHMLAPFVSKR